MRFNQSKPVDYDAHSVSMGDVVAIQRKTNDKIMVLEMARYEYYGWAPE